VDNTVAEYPGFISGHKIRLSSAEISGFVPYVHAVITNPCTHGFMAHANFYTGS